MAKKEQRFELELLDLFDSAEACLLLSANLQGNVYYRLFKRSQHVGLTSSNIVGCNMLASFEHYVG